MGRALEALRVDLVEVLGAGGTGREPAASRDHLQASDRRVVAGSARELGRDGLARERRVLDRLRRQLLQRRLLLRRRGSIDARVVRGPEFLGERTVVLAGVLPRPRGDLGREQGHDQAVLVRGPGRAVLAEEARAGALLPAAA